MDIFVASHGGRKALLHLHLPDANTTYHTDWKDGVKSEEAHKSQLILAHTG
jgi:hypothetical protein